MQLYVRYIILYTKNKLHFMLNVRNSSKLYFQIKMIMYVFVYHKYETRQIKFERTETKRIKNTLLCINTNPNAYDDAYIYVATRFLIRKHLYIYIYIKSIYISRIYIDIYLKIYIRSIDNAHICHELNIYSYI